MREIWILSLAIFGLVALPPAYAATPPAVPAKAQSVLQIKKDDRILGKPTAPITIIEYASMTCPHCAEFQNHVLPTIKKQWIDTGKAKLIMRDFPLDGLALKAAMIARCAPPSRFYAFSDTFFATQPQWVLTKDPTAELQRIAELGGMSKQTFDSCLKNKNVEKEVLDSRLIASKDLGVDATPTFFVNGKKFAGAPTVAQFDDLLSSVSKKS